MKETWFGVMTTGAGPRDVLDAREADAEEPAGRRPEPGATGLEKPEREWGASSHRDTPAPAVTTTRPFRPLIVADRGAAAIAPEHTIPAYEAAVAAGADALWLDVQEAADEQLVVVRDARLERTTNGRGPVRERTVRELKRLDAGRWFGWRFRGQRIQTLPEVLERFRGRAGFVVALRAGSDVCPGIEERLLGLLYLYGAADRTLIASYDHHALQRCRVLDGDIRLGACVAGRLLARRPSRRPASLPRSASTRGWSSSATSPAAAKPGWSAT